MNRRPTRTTRLRTTLAALLVAACSATFIPVESARADSLREVAERVARQNDARVVSARVIERNGRRFYEIRIMTRDGVVRTIRVPAEGGRR